MKRAFWLVSALAMFSFMGCAVRATYSSWPLHEYWERGYYQHDQERHHDHDRDHHRRDDWQ